MTVRVQTLSGLRSTARRWKVAPRRAHRAAFTPFASYESGRAARFRSTSSSRRTGRTNSRRRCAGRRWFRSWAFPINRFRSKALNALSIQTDLANVADEAFVRRSLRLEGTTGLERLVPGAALESTPAPPLGTPALVEEPARPFGWSGARPMGNHLVTRKDPLPDGCLSLEFEASSQRTLSYFCGPAWGFPFEVGERVRFGSEQHLTIEGMGEPSAEGVAMSFGLDSQAVRASAAPAYVTGCGAFVEPLDVAVAGVTMSSGQDREERTTSGVKRYMLAALNRCSSPCLTASSNAPCWECASIS